jgi:hypothetical protein
MICHSCRTEFQLKERISRTDECPSCGADIHCCLNCTNYDTAAHNRCREPQAEWVTDRERANFCDYFNPITQNVAAGQQRKINPQTGDARSAFENLFKK